MSAPGPFEGQLLDLFELEASLGEEERLIAATTRRWVRDRVLPHVDDWFERGMFPAEISLELGKLGLLGMHLTGYGCAGSGAVSYGLACLELEAGDSGLRSFVSVQGSLAMFRSGGSAPRSRSGSGSPRWRPARRSAASA